MNKIILQPAGNPAAIVNYQNTILSPVSMETIRPFLPATAVHDLQEIYPSGQAILWGAAGAASAKQWQKITTGDVTLFSRNGAIYSAAVVSYKIQAQELAKHLWGEKSPGLTWEYVFFLDELRPLNISYAAFNQVAGYALNNVIQGFTVLSEEKSQAILATFDLSSETYVEDIDPGTFEEINKRLDGLEETDSEVKSYRRLEQGYLKNKLFGRRTLGTCAICQNEFPVALLVAAHIKKRANCSLEERKDVHVVMPVCKFGCDDLFERGFIAVIAGQVISLNKQPSSAYVEKNITDLVGRTCVYYHDRTAKYFEAHYESHKLANS